MSRPFPELRRGVNPTHVSRGKRERERGPRTHLLGQGIQVREGFESIRLVCELLEQRRVLDGVYEIVGDLRCQSPLCGGERTEGVNLRGSIPCRPR